MRTKDTFSYSKDGVERFTVLSNNQDSAGIEISTTSGISGTEHHHHKLKSEVGQKVKKNIQLYYAMKFLSGV